jgi:hypothetical protein
VSRALVVRSSTATKMLRLWNGGREYSTTADGVHACQRRAFGAFCVARDGDISRLIRTRGAVWNGTAQDRQPRSRPRSVTSAASIGYGQYLIWSLTWGKRRSGIGDGWSVALARVPGGQARGWLLEPYPKPMAGVAHEHDDAHLRAVIQSLTLLGGRR